MKIDFVTIRRTNSWGDESERHEVRVDDNIYMSQSDSIEPEDVQFYRDLSSPHDCWNLVEEVIEAVKRGDTIDMNWVDEDD